MCQVYFDILGMYYKTKHVGAMPQGNYLQWEELRLTKQESKYQMWINAMQKI